MIDNLQIYHISSLDRHEGNTNKFIVDLNIDQSLLNNLTHVSLISIAIPKSYYNIQKNSYINLYENNNLIIINVEEGNYTLTQLLKVLTTKFNNQTLNNVIYNFQKNKIDYDDGKIKITCNKSEIIKKIYIEENELYESLGLNKFKYYEFSDILISDNVVNLSSNNVIYLHSNIVSSPFNDLNTSGNNILCYINNCGSCPSYSYIIKDYDIISNMKRLKFNSNMLFFLTSENRDIDLNGCNFNFSLVFFRYIDNYPFYKKISNYIDYELIK